MAGQLLRRRDLLYKRLNTSGKITFEIFQKKEKKEEMHAAAKIADLDASFCLTEPISSEDVLDILGKSREEVDLVLAVPTWASRKGMKRRAEVIDEAVSQLASVFLARFPGWIRERGDDVVPLLPSFKAENMRNRRIVQTYFKSIKKYAGVQLIVKSDDCPPAKKQRYER